MVNLIGDVSKINGILMIYWRMMSVPCLPCNIPFTTVAIHGMWEVEQGNRLTFEDDLMYDYILLVVRVKKTVLTICSGEI